MDRSLEMMSRDIGCELLSRTSEDDSTFKCTIFTLNCWGVPCISKDRRTRMTAIAEHVLNSSIIDFVCFQAVWCKKDYLFLSKACVSEYPFSHYFNSFISGSGLCILSKYPIIDVYFHRWPINGYAHKVQQGDWYGGKGVGLCRIQMYNTVINVYNAHLHGEYNYETLDYSTHRMLQAFDMSQFVNLTSGTADVTILAGSLNTEPQSLAIKILTRNGQMVDSFDTAQTKSPSSLGTAGSYRNSFSPKAEIKRQPEGKRFDYILYKDCCDMMLQALEYSFPLPVRVPGQTCSYSDHEAVQLTLQGTRGSHVKRIPRGDAEELRTTINECLAVCNISLSDVDVRRRKYLAISVLLGLLLFILLFIELSWRGEMGTGTNATISICFNLMKIVSTGALLFTLLMALLWHRMEKSAIQQAKYTMVLIHDKLSNSLSTIVN